MHEGIPTLLGVPFDAAASAERGAAGGPAGARAGLAAPSSNGWTEDGLDIAAAGIMEDAGDVPLPDPEDGPSARTAIEAAVAGLLDRGARPLVLGGDHSITYPVIRAMARRHPGLSILHLDAHADLYDHYEGDRYSHACPFARILEDGLAARLVQVGLRTSSRHLREQQTRFGVEVHEMRRWEGPFVTRFDGPVYLSLDLDVLDPAFISGIAHPEPGGLSVRDVIAMVQRLQGRLVGADLVELNPSKDGTPVSGLVAAKLIKEIVAAMWRTSADD